MRTIFLIKLSSKKQANKLCEYISDMPAGEDKHFKEKRRQGAFNFSVLYPKKVEMTLENALSTLNRVPEIINDLKPR